MTERHPVAHLSGRNRENRIGEGTSGNGEAVTGAAKRHVGIGAGEILRSILLIYPCLLSFFAPIKAVETLFPTHVGTLPMKVGPIEVRCVAPWPTGLRLDYSVIYGSLLTHFSPGGGVICMWMNIFIN